MILLKTLLIRFNEATIANRLSKVKGVIYKVYAIIADHIMQVMGGMQVA